MSLIHKLAEQFSTRRLGGHSPAQNRRLQIMNETREIELASSAELADTSAKRSLGLLGRKGLEPGGAMWITPCESVHTFGMQFALDLVYLDRHKRIVKVRRNVPPWRLSACLQAHSIIEFAAGSIDDKNAQPGDQLLITAITNSPEGKALSQPS